MLFSSKQCNKTILDSVFVISYTVNNQGLSKYYQPRPLARLTTLTRPRLFWISQKPHPIIVYYHSCLQIRFIIAAIKFGLLIFKLPKCLELKWF